MITMMISRKDAKAQRVIMYRMHLPEAGVFYNPFVTGHIKCPALWLAANRPHGREKVWLRPRGRSTEGSYAGGFTPPA